MARLRTVFRRELELEGGMTALENSQDPDLGTRDRGRVIAWVLLGLPLLIYALVWPVRARLDRGVIEEHLSGPIWRQMVQRLPEIGWQPAFDALFVIGLIAFLAGSLLLVWLALDRSNDTPETTSDPSLASEFFVPK